MLLLYRGETLDGHGLLVDDDKAITAFKTTTANAADARKISKTSTPCTKLSVQPHGWGKRAARTEKVQCTASKLGKIHREGIISAWTGDLKDSSIGMAELMYGCFIAYLEWNVAPKIKLRTSCAIRLGPLILRLGAEIIAKTTYTR